ncbi:endonuclease V [Sulfodiicoccus acidiphilus]|uniref:Endonuclease V n=1 Tax=Sulfodiicoccus acidiphilus TaxID=1670455 RepID=A0A348B4G8_9CREN|nr:endonuclease V [Sulfodiicoccus acidiphilus]GGU04039.1 endonuclease V [Sulfodiicoccus acidiphilus]
MDHLTVELLYSIQELVARNVKEEDLDLSAVRSVCCADVSYWRGEAFGVAVREQDGQRQVLRAEAKVDFPYVPGLLFVREAPVLLHLLRGIQCDLTFVDGHGLAHPRFAGLATVVGVLLQRPTVGVAKSRLTGELKEEGDITFVEVKGRRVGVKRGRYYYSVGNMVSLNNVVELSSRGYPPCLREADAETKRFRREYSLRIKGGG